MRLVVSVTAWGARCVPLFTGPVLDSHADALRRFDGDVRYIVHTDSPEVVRMAVTEKTGRAVECRPVTIGSNPYATVMVCQLDAIKDAKDGEVIVILNADILVSVECFEAIAALVTAGKKMVMCCGTRTLPKAWPKRDISSAELLSWAMRNQHPIIRECFYGTGTTDLPWAIYFRRGASTVLRGFHLHPLAVVNDRPLTFNKSVDWDLAELFSNDEIHVVTAKDELSLAEVSPPDKPLKLLGRPFVAEDIVAWTRRKAIPFHWWLFSHRIVIEGDDVDCGDGALYETLMAREKLRAA